MFAAGERAGPMFRLGHDEAKGSIDDVLALTRSTCDCHSNVRTHDETGPLKRLAGSVMALRENASPRNRSLSNDKKSYEMPEKWA